MSVSFLLYDLFAFEWNVSLSKTFCGLALLTDCLEKKQSSNWPPDATLQRIIPVVDFLPDRICATVAEKLHAIAVLKTSY